MPTTDHDRYDDAMLRDIFARIHTIAVVGLSDNPSRPSLGVARTLLRHGYRVFGVNPNVAADAIPGLPCVPTLADAPETIDMVDVFRQRSALAGVLEETLALPARPAVFWTQLGLRDDAVAARAEAAGLRVVMDRCPAIELARFAR